MPEGLEAEIWRRACGVVVGRTITDAWVDERVAPSELVGVARGARIVEVGRSGKVLTISLDRDHVLGLHFGMTGRLVVDGVAPIERLEYASGADRADWDRLRLHTDSHTQSDTADTVPAIRMNDPRRLGRISLDPDLSALGPEAVTLTSGELGTALARRSAAIKTLLLDQGVVAGLGNLCADEVLFHAGIDPRRPADSLAEREVEAIASACRDRLPVMLERGGSTCGDLTPDVRARLDRCPLDGVPLCRATIGGRTAVWCSQHQR